MATLPRTVGDGCLWGEVSVAGPGAQGRSPRSLTEADFLLRVDDETRQGALRFSDATGGPFLAPQADGRIPPLLQLRELMARVDRVESETDNQEDDLRLLLAPGASLGGARPKASIRHPSGRLLIAKFPKADDEWSVTVWEAVALALAAKAGINVARAEIAERQALLVRRFDRRNGQRIPFLSARSMLDVTDRDPRSYPEIADALRRYGAAPTADLKELWQRIVFTVLISNRDDHLRNHGFLRPGDGGWRLSPAYDLNPTPAHAGGRFLATAIVAGDTRASLELAFETARYYGITPSAAREIVAEVAAVVSGWRDEASQFGLRRSEEELMASAFEHEEFDRARRSPTFL